VLVIFFTSALFLVLFSSFQAFWPIVCYFLFIVFLLSNNSFFNSALSLAQATTIIDPTSLFIVFLLFLVMYISYIRALDFGSYKTISFVFLFLSLFCYQVFTTSHLFLLYFFYEASLVPILYIIIKWGSYPERSIRAMIMLVYTLLFGAPVLMLVMYFNTVSGTWLFPVYSFSSESLLFRVLIFLCFSVKLPIYGLHFWLPMAHVEAPTFGSVILASLLLKLGGVGLLRLAELIAISSISIRILSYFIVFIIFRRLVCCYQSDMKRLIAYSSVAHMIVIPFLILSNNLLSVQALILVILLHGLRSSLLFITVGILYSMFSSRQLVLIRGLLLVSPLFSFIIILTFLFSLSAPPMPSYVAEVFFILSSYVLSPYMIYVVLVFAFLGLLYNLNWLSSVLFSTGLSIIYRQSTLKFNLFLPLLVTFRAVFPFSCLFYIL
jgi:NADH:ubiquinone oxidoreductase subunit 4 (subunit M)